MLTSPATCGHDAVLPFCLQLLPLLLASGAPIVSNRMPDDAVLSFDTTVLLMKFTAKASTNETPAPSQPDTLLTMMLLVSDTEFQPQLARFAFGHTEAPFGKLTTSEPLTLCSAMPPPVPLSA